MESNKTNKMANNKRKTLKYIDLFCGIGGFRIAMEKACQGYRINAECVFSSDIDIECQKEYEANFEERPSADINDISANSIPDHDILLAGFPCQPFSIIGQMKGFEDTRGTLFFEIARILEVKRPQAFILENLKLLVGHNKGKTISRVMETLRSLGYLVDYQVLNALDFGLPHKRERIFIVGFKKPCVFDWPPGNIPMKPLSEVLERKVPEKFYASDHIRNKRWSRMEPTDETTIWHENKSGHISAYPYSCALRAGASYNYLLVNGERRLMLREMLRLQGFPDDYKIVCSDSQIRKQAGNSLPVPVATAVIKKVIEACNFCIPSTSKTSEYLTINGQLMLFEKSAHYNGKTKTKNRRKIQASIHS